MPGSVTFVGTGIRAVAQLTIETINWIQTSERFYYLVNDFVTQAWIEENRPDGLSLRDCYNDGEDRMLAYVRMRDRILGAVREGREVCVAFYGHPAIFVNPTFQVIAAARKEGFEARILPGVSAEDCLFAELEVDPSVDGCQSFESTDFLITARPVDPHAALVLWQIGVLGDGSFRLMADYDKRKLDVMVEYLCKYYPPAHKVAVYEAALYGLGGPKRHWVALSDLASAPITPNSTLYVPPVSPRPLVNSMMDKLGIPLPPNKIGRTEPEARPEPVA